RVRLAQHQTVQSDLLLTFLRFGTVPKQKLKQRRS
ncbi:hypothetical protein MPH_06437, partial [Macrophomina phaseolina MS6]